MKEGGKSYRGKERQILKRGEEECPTEGREGGSCEGRRRWREFYPGMATLAGSIQD